MNNLEIERKFTVKNLSFKDQAYEVREIEQFCLSTPYHNSTEVRVSIRGDHAWLCIKSSDAKMSRFEFVKEITKEEANQLKSLAVGRIVSKTRYMILSGEGLIWEVDVFHGDDEGLVIAEIEVPEESFEIEFPEWIDEEVTGNKFYYNSFISFVSFKDRLKYAEDWVSFSQMNICGNAIN